MMENSEEKQNSTIEYDKKLRIHQTYFGHCITFFFLYSLIDNGNILHVLHIYKAKIESWSTVNKNPTEQ